MRPWGSVWARIRPIAQEIDSFVRSQMGTTAILHREGRRGRRPRTDVDLALPAPRYAALTRPTLTPIFAAPPITSELRNAEYVLQRIMDFSHEVVEVRDVTPTLNNPTTLPSQEARQVPEKR